MSFVRMRRIAVVNPRTPKFEVLRPQQELNFLPLEAVWPRSWFTRCEVTSKSAVDTGYTRFQDGDILVPKITPTFEAGRSILANHLTNGVGAGSTELHVLRPGPEVDARYLLYVTRSRDFLELGASEMLGVAGQKRVLESFVQDYKVWLPNLEEQQRIAEYLARQADLFDDLQRGRAEQLALLKERRASLLSRCMTSGATGRELASHQRLGMVSTAVPIHRLKMCVGGVGVGVVVNPSDYFSIDGVPFVHGSNVRDGWFDLRSVKRITSQQSSILHRSQLHTGDVVVVRAGYPGRSAVVPSALEGANCASVLILRRGRRALPMWISTFFNSPQGRRQVEMALYGAAQEQINVSDVVDFLMPCPTLPDQERLLDQLAEQIMPMDLLVNSIERQRHLLTERHKALITAAVTGQIDVSTARGVAV